MTNLLVPALLAAMGFVGIVIASTMKPALRVYVAALLVVPQIIVAGALLSVSDVWMLAVGLLGLVRRRKLTGGTRIVALLYALAAVTTFSLAWSEPSAFNGAILTIVRLLIFAVFLAEVAQVGKETPDVLIRALAIAGPMLAAQAVLVIVFRLSNPAELAFMGSPVGGVLVGPAAGALFTGYENNVLDPEKAGGLFVNGNVASMFNGVAAFAMFAAGNRTGRRLPYLLAVLCLAAVVATGSKTGLTLAVLLSAFAFVLPRITRARRRGLIAPLVLLGAAISVWLPDWISTAFPSYANDTGVSAGARGQLWAGAAQLFGQHPILGLGFGGWKREIVRHVGTGDLPPHNMIIAAWANSGLLAAALTVAVIIAVTLALLSAVWGMADDRDRRLLTFVLCAWVWVFVHGMGDNTSIYGDPRTAGLLALLAATSMAVTTGRIPAVEQRQRVEA